MVNILGINLSEFSQTEVLKKIADFLKDNKQHYIVTPNPEIILAAHADEEFFYVLNQADLSLADGFGLKIAGFFFGENIPRVTGADITIELLKFSSENKTRVMILNWEKGLSQINDIKNSLNQKFPGLIFDVINISREKFLNDEIINKINLYSPAILFNTLGFPYQEKLMYHNINKLASVKVALGIGGSFDFITEKIKRAPKIFRALGLEWFWRLANAFNYQNSGQRIKRIYRATFVFLAKVIKVRFIYPFIYRNNVACFLFKKEGTETKVLIVERTDVPGHWQLPQGGTDGENIEIAGSRELREELSTDKFIARASFKKVYRYLFRDRGKDDTRMFKNYKGQSQGLFIAEFTGIDQDIKINFWDHSAWKWVPTDKLPESVHRVRRQGSELFLKKFQSIKLN
ncbi:MAG: WecB/TagA/CpsF family glycosyltransferase [Candidatus Falkowbacteria bacterium]